jgi:hypothetical protein
LGRLGGYDEAEAYKRLRFERYGNLQPRKLGEIGVEDPNSLIARFLKAVYLHTCGFLDVQVGGSPSHV